MEKFAVIGSGLIGRAWAMVFARAGHCVRLYDIDRAAAERAQGLILESLAHLREFGLIEETPQTVSTRITLAAGIDEAVADADYVQENTAEKLEVKLDVFSAMDAAAPPHAILASSTSFIPTSAFSAHLPGRSRCLVAHPVNPPYVVPVVELSPAPWTDPQVVERARKIQEKVGQVPIIVKKEIDGFILNRMQSVLLAEAFRLVEDGYVSVDDLDKCIKDGLGLRWSFMGPFETIDLNAPGGIGDYAARFGPTIQKVDASKQSQPRPWSPALIAQLERERRAVLPADQHGAREAWRDRRLMGLIAHKRAMNKAET